MTVADLCRHAGMSKQNFYKDKRARSREAVDEGLVVELVRQERRVQPMLGGRKLMAVLAGSFAEAGVEIGRDRFFEVLRREDLLVERRKRSCRTTDSRHRFRVFGNLLKEMELTAPCQAWVCDITYVRTEEGFVYLALVMDAWSRKITGFHAGDTLEAEGCLAALRMALAGLPADAKPVHHSDRGTQYCCNEYHALLVGRELPVSMTVENHCYENAKAERLNGILKQEYGLGGTFRTRREAVLAAAQAVALYNTRRPHTALGLKTPEQAHAMAA